MLSVSYVVPTLNSSKTLDYTLLSLVKQIGVNVEIIVVDSDSTDETLDICQKWGVKVLYAKPGNMYHAINVGLSQCTSEWIGYLNSDDYLYPDSILRLINLANTKQADLVYGNCDYVDVHGRFMYSFSPPEPKHLMSFCRTGSIGFAQQTSIFKNSLYKSINGFDDSYQLVADRDFFIRALTSNASFSILRGPSIACFRLHDNQFSQSRKSLMIEESKKIIDNLEDRKFSDIAVRFMWKIKNIPNFVIRIARQSLLAQKVVIHQSMHSGSHFNT